MRTKSSVQKPNLSFLAKFFISIPNSQSHNPNPPIPIPQWRCAQRLFRKFYILMGSCLLMWFEALSKLGHVFLSTVAVSDLRVWFHFFPTVVVGASYRPSPYSYCAFCISSFRHQDNLPLLGDNKESVPNTPVEGAIGHLIAFVDSL